MVNDFLRKRFFVLYLYHMKTKATVISIKFLGEFRLVLLCYLLLLTVGNFVTVSHPIGVNNYQACYFPCYFPVILCYAPCYFSVNSLLFSSGFRVINTHKSDYS